MERKQWKEKEWCGKERKRIEKIRKERKGRQSNGKRDTKESSGTDRTIRHFGELLRL